MVNESDAKAEVVESKNEINSDKSKHGDTKNGYPSSASGFFKTVDGKTVEIRDVWASNLDEEMEIIRDLIEKHSPYVAMDTEFPGVVARPVGDFGDVTFQTLRCNVDLLKLIQLGISFTDSEGNWVEGCTCWQFNFKFSLSGDMFAQDSIELLKTSGIDFDKFEDFGIDIQYFGELMMMSGLVLNDEIKWISFHSSYDFGYLLKTLTCSELPLEEPAFLELLLTYFPCIYDVKYMMTSVEGLHGGLSSLAETLAIDRIGPMHQAGSDSLLTAQTYFGLINKHMNKTCDDAKFKGELFGLGTNHTKYKPKGYGLQGQGGSNNNNNNSNTPALQYSSSVHYGTNNNSIPNGTIHQGSSNNFGYGDEGVM
jgi:CCR4-NOT transcription complex subunit 7/8